MNLLRIHSISILGLLVTSIVISGSHLGKGKDSRILRISPPPDSAYSDKNANILSSETQKTKVSGKELNISNKELFSKLGLSKIRIPASHSRKRLAVESRHHARADDSHMFVIKLPPNPYYYTNTKPSHLKNSVEENEKKVSSFGFRSNGKPGRIYHWNIPVLKKIAFNDGRSPMSRQNIDISDLIDIKNIPTWSKPWENETIEKAYGKLGTDTKNIKKKKKSPTYYAPAKAKKNNYHNYFPGNGKPKGFYVIQNSHKPSYYRKLIP